MYGRAVLVACLLVLAGCNGAPAGDPTEAATVTPAPVPDAADRPDAGSNTSDAPDIGVVDGTVDGAALGAAHADIRRIPHTRTHEVSVRAGNATLLEYRGVLTLVGTESRRLKEYAGPATARYLPGDADARSAREERYVADGETQVRRTVDGTLRETDGSPPGRLRAPVDIGDEAAVVETLLDGATVVGGGSSPGYRVVASGVDPAAVPGVLEAPRNGTVRGSVRRDGRVTRIEVRYEATLDGRPVAVEQTLEWTRPSEPYVSLPGAPRMLGTLSVARVDVALFVLIGLLGGAHCIGMCGPLVTLYASRMRPATDGGAAAPADHGRHRGHLSVFEVRQHALFNVGRAASYTLLGAVSGALGGALFVTADELTATAGLVRGAVGVAAGGVVVVVGGRYLLGRPSAGVHLPGLDRVAGWLTGGVDRLAGGPGVVALGGLHGLLPCPILYPAYLYAFASGSATTGAVALGALGVGTIPAVFAYGTVVESVGATRRRRLHRLLGAAFVVLGYVLLAHGLMAVGVHVPHPRLPHFQPLAVLPS